MRRAKRPAFHALSISAEPTATDTHVATWKKPPASVLTSKPATVFAGWPPAAVSMWCHCRIWCNTMSSMKAAEADTHEQPGQFWGTRFAQSPPYL